MDSKQQDLCVKSFNILLAEILAIANILLESGLVTIFGGFVRDHCFNSQFDYYHTLHKRTFENIGTLRLPNDIDCFITLTPMSGVLETTLSLLLKKGYQAHTHMHKNYMGIKVHQLKVFRNSILVIKIDVLKKAPEFYDFYENSLMLTNSGITINIENNVFQKLSIIEEITQRIRLKKMVRYENASLAIRRYKKFYDLGYTIYNIFFQLIDFGIKCKYCGTIISFAMGKLVTEIKSCHICGNDLNVKL